LPSKNNPGQSFLSLLWQDCLAHSVLAARQILGLLNKILLLLS
jgi:hypothetical protein